MFPYVQHVSPYSSILSNTSLHIFKFLKCCFHILWLVFFEFNSSPAQLHYHRLTITPLYPLAWDILIGCWVMIIQAICQLITPLAVAWRSKAVRFVPTNLTHPETKSLLHGAPGIFLPGKPVNRFSLYSIQMVRMENHLFYSYPLERNWPPFLPVKIYLAKLWYFTNLDFPDF